VARPKKNTEDAAARAAREQALHQQMEEQRAIAREAANTLAANTLVGDIRDWMLNRLRWEQDRRPWDQRSEADQKLTVQTVEEAVRDMVDKAVQVMAAAGQPTITGTLESVMIKDGIKATVVLNKHNAERMKLYDAQGGVVLIVIADAEAFHGEKAPVKIVRDQKDISDVLAEHSSDDADQAAEKADAIVNGADVKPGWRADRDFRDNTQSPLD
jgi:hypothetical protein